MLVNLNSLVVGNGGNTFPIYIFMKGVHFDAYVFHFSLLHVLSLIAFLKTVVCKDANNPFHVLIIHTYLESLNFISVNSLIGSFTLLFIC